MRLNMKRLPNLAPRGSSAVTLPLALLTVGWIVALVGAQEGPQAAKGKKPQVGVLINEPASFRGYTLVFPLGSKKTYLVDMQGRVVRTWESKYTAGQDAYLLENGNMLRAAKLSNNEALFAGEGAGGRVQRFTWDGQLVWLWSYTAPKKSDFFAAMMSGAQRLPNGDTLISNGFGGTIFEVTPASEIVWKYITPNDSSSGGFGPGGGKGPGGFGGMGGSPIFRAYKYGPDYPGLQGKDLTPGLTIEELRANQPKAKEPQGKQPK